MFCPSCGAENTETAAFCAKCGTKINTSTPNPQPPVAPTAKPAVASRKAIDFLPNAAEGVAMPIALGAIIASFVGMIAGWCGDFGDIWSLVGNIPSQTLEVVLLFALCGGLKRTGSPTSKVVGWLCLISILLIPFSVVSSVPDVLPESTQLQLAEADIKVVFAAAFIDIVFLVSVLRRHKGNLCKFAVIQLGATIIGLVVGLSSLSEETGDIVVFIVDAFATITLANVLSKERMADILKRMASMKV